MVYQYFLQIVPTVYKKQGDNGESLRTGQFSVTRHISVNTNRLPGLFFKYDSFPILVTVQYSPYSIWHLLIRLSGIVGGVFATSGKLVGVLRVVLITCLIFQLNFYVLVSFRALAPSTPLGH